jgi:hypothetical protein
VTRPDDDSPETTRQAENELLKEQEGEGYGEDQRGPEEALEAEDEQ